MPASADAAPDCTAERKLLELLESVRERITDGEYLLLCRAAATMRIYRTCALKYDLGLHARTQRRVRCDRRELERSIWRLCAHLRALQRHR